MIVLTLLLFLFTILCSYVTFTTLEGIHEMRRCKKESPSGGYYQTLSFGEYLAISYLKDRCEISVEKLPQGGYNIHPYNWKKTLRFKGERYSSLDD